MINPKTYDVKTLHLMVLPSIVIVILFRYIPIAGIIIAFQNFKPAKGFLSPLQEWVGFDNFKYLFMMPDTYRVVRNTLVIAILRITAGLIVPIVISLLINEVQIQKFKRIVQTSIYLPHFISWVILGGILVDILASRGIVNSVLGIVGIDPVAFLAEKTLFPAVVIITHVWKEFGYGTIIYLATITKINPTLYEAASMDGAGRFKQTWHITLPGMIPIIVLMTTLSLGSVLDAGFDQIFNLYSPIVYETGDIIDTFVYRLGIENAKYSLASAVGLFKSVVSFILITVSYFIAYRAVKYRIF